MNQTERESMDRVLKFAEFSNRLVDYLMVVVVSTGAETPIRNVINLCDATATLEDFSVVRAMLAASAREESSGE